MGWLAPLALLAGAYACSSADSGGTAGAAGGSACAANSDCASGSCNSDGRCGIGGGDACSTNAECASGTCENGSCTSTGSGGTTGNTGGSTSTGGTTGNPDGGPIGTPCTSNDECQSGVCENNACTGGPGTGGSGTGGFGGGPGGIGGTPGAGFPGSGNGYRPLTPGCGPETADQCTGECEQTGGVPSTVVRPAATLCFTAPTGDATPNDPSVVIEQIVEIINGVEYVHIRITFDPSFTDNTFGEGSCCGWGEQRGHRFSDLTGSDHAEVLLTDGNNVTTLHFKIDLITSDPTGAASTCGFGTLGVTGGDGSMIIPQGDSSSIVAVATSLDRNLGGCGYCESDACAPSGDCTVDSPQTDTNYTSNAATPDWDYRQVYEVWILASAFGDAGFGQAFITSVHSSPSKTTDTIQVEPTPCPPEWDKPYCPPGVIAEGGNCFGSGGSGGTDGGTGTGGSGTGGSAGDGGTTCPPNFQSYITSEGATICTPIPFANYPDRAPCPTGYVLDLVSEGQYCLPASGT
jgi:hypothetical protein